MRLGRNQVSLLYSLDDHKGWRDHFSTGWVWDSHGGTRRMLDRLHDLGLVCRFRRADETFTRYEISPKGKRELIARSQTANKRH